MFCSHNSFDLFDHTGKDVSCRRTGKCRGKKGKDEGMSGMLKVVLCHFCTQNLHNFPPPNSGQFHSINIKAQTEDN